MYSTCLLSNQVRKNLPLYSPMSRAKLEVFEDLAEPSGLQKCEVKKTYRFTDQEYLRVSSYMVNQLLF